MINGYYFVMSFYGWYIWTRKVDSEHVTPISKTTKNEQFLGVLFLYDVTMVLYVYQIFEMWTSWVAYVDTFTTALFFVGMWLMAKRKIENWFFGLLQI